jgi:hypothetical protein
MVLCGAGVRSGGRGRPAAACVGLLLMALAGCSPIETYRSLTGASRNDPDPETAPFTRNLAEADASPYPNLASVPPPPTRAMSAAERQQLTQSLVTERGAAQTAAATPPPVPAAPVPPSDRQQVIQSLAAARNAALAAATPPAASPPPAPAAPPPSTVAAATPPPAPLVAPAAPAPTAVTSPPPAAAPAAQPTAPGPSAAAAASSASRFGPRGAATNRRQMNEPPEPSPRDSALAMPEVRSVPEPEAPRPAPPPPHLPAPPAIASSAEPPPAAVASAAPLPPPPVPAIVAPPPPSLGRTDARRAAAATGTLATLDVAGTPPRLDDNAQGQIARVAALYKEQPAPIRVTAFAAPAASGGDALANYQAALERAKVIAKALTAAGIPADKVQSEATPAGAAASPDRIEIRFALPATTAGPRP